MLPKPGPSGSGHEQCPSAEDVLVADLMLAEIPRNGGSTSCPTLCPMTKVETVRAPTGRAEAPTRAHWWILVIIASAQLMVVLDSTIMIIALPSAQRSLGFSNVDRQWVVTAYTLGFGGLLLLGGRISDMIGPKRTLMIGVARVRGRLRPRWSLADHRHAHGRPGAAGRLRGPAGAVGALPSDHHLHRPPGAGRAFGIYASIAIAGAAFGLILGGLLTQYSTGGGACM